MSEMSADTRTCAKKYDKLIAAAKAVPSVSTIVVHPCDETSLRGAVDSAEAGIIQPILVGPEAKIRNTADKYGLDISRFEIVDAPHSEAAAAKGVELIHAAKGEMLMKGSLHTDELMRSVTAKTIGLRTERRISHVMPTPCSRPMRRSTSSRISTASGTSFRTRLTSSRKPASAHCRA